MGVSMRLGGGRRGRGEGREEKGKEGKGSVGSRVHYVWGSPGRLPA